MLFSIIMCTYNSERTVRYSVDSVIDQTCQDWELIILDNGSKDQTREILKEYQNREQRISCEFRKDNVGWAKGIRICLSKARGEYMMFLGADDYLYYDRTLEDVQKEILEYQPDIVWTGCALAEFKDDAHRLIHEIIPRYHRYEKEDKQTELTEIMQSVYYNSVMHYVKTDFLRKHGIDFYDPFYGDCQGMTEALCKADRMTVLDRIEYVLTLNTSQTASKTDFDYDVSRQWESVKSAVPKIRAFQYSDELHYIAERIFRNLIAMTEDILLGGELRDKLMNRIQRSLPERFRKAEEWISSDAFGEMMFYAGREIMAERLLGAAGVLYWVCKKQERLTEEIKIRSKWLADFSETAFVCGEDGNVTWKQYFSECDAGKILSALENDANRHRIGAELLLKIEVAFENEEGKTRIENRLKEYYAFMQGPV